MIDIVTRGIATANRTRAAIRLPLDSRTRMTFAVTDSTGEVLGLYRMPDATTFSIDVSVAKARNVAYYADPARLQEIDQIPGLPAGVAFSSRTIRFAALPYFPEGQDNFPPGPFSILNDGGHPPRSPLNSGPPLPASAFTSVQGYDAFHPQTNFRDPANILNQNGIVFFPGGVPLYKDTDGDGVRDLVGGLGRQRRRRRPGRRRDLLRRAGLRAPGRRPPRRPGLRPRRPPAVPEVQPQPLRLRRDQGPGTRDDAVMRKPVVQCQRLDYWLFLRLVPGPWSRRLGPAGRTRPAGAVGVHRPVSVGHPFDDPPQVPTRVGQGVDVPLGVPPGHDEAGEPQQGQVAGEDRHAASDLGLEGADGPLAVPEQQEHAEPDGVGRLLEPRGQAADVGRAGGRFGGGLLRMSGGGHEKASFKNFEFLVIQRIPKSICLSTYLFGYSLSGPVPGGLGIPG